MRVTNFTGKKDLLVISGAYTVGSAVAIAAYLALCDFAIMMLNSLAIHM